MSSPGLCRYSVEMLNYADGTYRPLKNSNTIAKFNPAKPHRGIAQEETDYYSLYFLNTSSYSEATVSEKL